MLPKNRLKCVTYSHRLDIILDIAVVKFSLLWDHNIMALQAAFRTAARDLTIAV